MEKANMPLRQEEATNVHPVGLFSKDFSAGASVDQAIFEADVNALGIDFHLF
jgi:hypothetical protein